MFIVILLAIVMAERTYGSVELHGQVEVRDGDTLCVDVPEWPEIIGSKILVRVYGIDTPELHDKRPVIRAKAVHAKNVLESFVSNGNRIVLVDLRRDKYFRLNARVMVDGKDAGEMMIKRHLARPYFGDTKDPW